MPAAYDKYDYPSYWIGREYEHTSEIHAISSFLKKIPKVKNIIEIGAGYGRLVPSYVFRSKKLIITDPSSKLLGIARKKLKPVKNIKFVQGSLETLDQKFRRNSFDLVIMVRVLHHIKDTNEAFKTIDKILKNRGYLILEFPNKIHFKANLKQFFHGNFTFPIDISEKDLTKKKKKCLPFKNYHPYTIIQQLEHQNFEIMEKRSVSNIRSPILKKLLPTEVRLAIETIFQKPLSLINFGPSIFVLAKKRSIAAK